MSVLKVADTIRAIGDRLRRRSDTEHEQAIVRLLIVCLIFLYAVHHVTADGRVDAGEFRVLRFGTLYVVFSLCVLAGILWRPAASALRRCVGMVADIGATAYSMSFFGEAGGPLFVVLLWVVFGNGFRYGRRYLFAAAVLGAVCFSGVIAVNPYWSSQPWLAGGLLLGLLILPSYVSSLLTKLRVAVARAEEASEAKTQFLANMSHEMRTPLNGIIGMVDVLRDTPLSAEQAEFAETIHASGRTLLHLINDVLDIAKIEAGRITIETTDFDLHSLVDTCTAMLAPQARTKGLRLSAQISPPVPFLLRGDPLHLRQVILNLLGNAIKFTEQGEVTLKAFLLEQDGARSLLKVEVADTGIGIPLQVQGRIFDRFTQADESITRRYGGTGLGTTIAKQLVELMGGEIGLTSQVGVGSTFWFTAKIEKTVSVRAQPVEAVAPEPVGKSPLPNGRDRAKPERDRGDGVIYLANRYRQQGPKGRGLKILVAEDNLTNQKVISKVLERAGYGVRLVENGEEALDALEAEAFDAVLMDLHMPVMGGLEAARFYRVAHLGQPRLPIVALSADARPEAMGICDDSGFDEYLTKPVEAKRLLELLDKLLPGVVPSEEGLSSRVGFPGQGSPAHREPCRVVDAAVIGELEVLDEGGGFVSDLIHAFLSEGEEMLVAMESAAAAHNAEQFRELAHALQGSAGSIGATVLHEQASECAHSGNLELGTEGLSRVRRLKEEFALVEVALAGHTSTRKAAAL